MFYRICSISRLNPLDANLDFNYGMTIPSKTVVSNAELIFSNSFELGLTLVKWIFRNFKHFVYVCQRVTQVLFNISYKLIFSHNITTQEFSGPQRLYSIKLI